ncbi:hypothetical protein PRK78_002542 [Emydomyces testavorans]|uniref:Immediate-early protein n=1 Tax=Emydomyces testavorans TaxID=2070801 RepID=A0AAF0DGJ6_9EURO|nr:hypothetical protein PRK78_002542 [Emydomyces testavorans]
MFSHLVTAARGLFASSDSSQIPSDLNREETGSDLKTMVTATRRSILSHTEDSRSKSSSPATNGKRKTPSLTIDGAIEPIPKRRRSQSKEDTDSQASIPQANGVKKRRYQVLEAVEIRVEGRSGTQKSSVVASGACIKPQAVSQSAASKLKTAHLRFDSEEPQPEPHGVEDGSSKEEQTVPSQQHDEDGSDDEAPDAISNTQQLQELKEAERKREDAKQRQIQLRKEKRREHEKRLQLQAKSKPAPEPFIVPSKPALTQKQEEILSESSATLQGSEVKAPQSAPRFPITIPKLLPDEILLAEPSLRLPTPPRETEKQSTMSKPSGSKLRFLEMVEKKPKDIKLGAMSIRVLEESGNSASRNGLHNALPPRASKQGRTIRENWMAGNRRGGGAINGGLRRTAGGLSGFLRK